MSFPQKNYPIKIVVFLIITLCSSTFSASASEITRYYISPSGSNLNSGTSSQEPFKTIQHGLDIAKPGTVLNLAKGVYRETLTTKINGTENSPIIIRGTDNAKSGDLQTILYGTGRIINVNHSFYRFEDFTVDGEEEIAGKIWPVNPDEVIPFKEQNRSLIKDSKLIYIGSDDNSREITGVKITNMRLRGAGGECVRLRNAAHHNEISNSVIEFCGMFGKENGDAFIYHNGEGVYIGTSPKSTTQPMHKNDTSSYNVVSDNIIHTYGSECFNVKENAHHNSFINNECQYNLEPLEFSGSNIELRGDHNLVEGNIVSHSAGWNLKLKSDAPDYDKGGNIIRRNTFTNAKGTNITNEAGGVKFCGNKVDNKLKGVTAAEATKQCP